MEPIATRQGNSEEAQEFLRHSLAARWEPVDLSPNGIQLLRSENSQVAVSGCLKVKEELHTRTEDGLVGDVSVQWVIPQQVEGPEVVLYFFGGGFMCGCPEDDLSITARLADWMKRRICVPRYRLAPENPFPAAKNDVSNVYKQLIENGRVIVVGESAGGNLALGLVLDVLSKGLSSPLAVGLLSPWADLTHSGSSHQMKQLDPTLSVEHFLTPVSLIYCGNQSPKDPEISPLFADFPKNFPPTTISSGTRDLLLSDCVRIAEKLLEKDCVVDLQITEGVWHVFEWYPNLPEASASLQHIASFLSQYIVPSTQ